MLLVALPDALTSCPYPSWGLRLVGLPSSVRCVHLRCPTQLGPRGSQPACDLPCWLNPD